MASQLNIVGVGAGDTVPFVDDEVKTFVIENNGASELTLSLENLSPGFEIVSPPASSVSTIGSTTLILKALSEYPGEFDQKITLLSNDPDNLSFSWYLEHSVDFVDPCYTTLKEIYRTGGKFNVNIWADLNGTEDPNEIYGVIIGHAMDLSRLLDSELSTGAYTVPFETDVPTVVKLITTRRVLMALYKGRGRYTDTLDQMHTSYKRQISSWVNEIRTGKLKLEAVTKTFSNIPKVSKG